MIASRLRQAIVPFAFALIAVAAPPALGVAPQRTFVASDGSDLNPCLRTSPCRSFGTAAAATAAGGEIIVLDSAGYGPVTLTQSVSIIAPTGVYAGISVLAGFSGVIINDPTAVVVLRGLSINGQGGTHGILIQQATRVHIESCVVSRMGFNGLELMSTATGAEVFVKDTIFRDNTVYAGYFSATGAKVTLDHIRAEHSGLSGFGVDGPASEITIRNVIVANSQGPFPQGHGFVSNVVGAVSISITDSEFIANVGSGLNLLASNTGRIVNISVARSTFRSNGARGIYASATAPSSIVVSVQDSIIADHSLASGMFADGSGVKATAARNTLTGNNYGFAQDNGATFESLRDNIVRNNTPGGEIFGIVTTLTGL